MDSKLEKIRVSNPKELQGLIDRFYNGPTFAMAFVFDTDELWEQFLNAVGLTIEKFNEKYYYFDDEKGIHISQSENGYVWISTMGLIAKSRSTDNRFLNACIWQKIVLNHLLDDAILLSESEDIYNIDGYNYSLIEELTPAMFHNTLFYFETLAKAYLSINKRDIPKKHKLSELLTLVKNTMFLKHHNNTLFHAHIIPMFETIVNYINSIPGKFREQYVKYDDNPQDQTVIDFSPKHLKDVRNLVEVSCDMVYEMYYDMEDCIYLHKNLYQRMMDRCENEEDRNRVKTAYGFLLDLPQSDL